MPEIEFFTATGCVFAERVHIALIEKGLEFRRSEIDLARKPEWFLVVAPRGEVPVIRHEDRFIADSTVILDYLEDVYPTPALRPRDPAGRAVARYWIEFADEALVPVLTRLPVPAGDAARVAELNALLTTIEREGLARCGQGPYWFGQEASLVDIVFYPLLRQVLLDQDEPSAALPLLPLRLRRWYAAMRQREAVVASQRPVEAAAPIPTRAAFPGRADGCPCPVG